MAKKKYTILFVDDEKYNLTVFRAAFRRYFNIFLANSAREGLEVLEKHHIQLVITDQRMPEMTGVEFLEKVVERFPDVIRIVLTGYSDVNEIIQAINSGRIYHYLTKPWNKHELKVVIDNGLEAYELRMENKKLIEDLRVANAQLSDTNQLLEEKVKERTKEIERQKRLIEEKSRFKEQFFASVSHELRTPLNGIIGVSSLLMETPLTEAQEEFTEVIKTSADNLLVIINDLLDISKMNVGKFELVSRVIPTNKLFSDLHKLIGVKASEKNIELIFQIDKKIPEYIICDNVRVYQILLNVLNNAIKFTDKGSVTLKAQNTQVADNHVIILFQIIDTGIGIPANHLPYIFDDFIQASNDEGRNYGGSGLGLTIVKQLSDLMGGEIDIQSEKGKGTILSIRLPFELPQAKDSKLLVSPKTRSQDLVADWSSKRILLIEDNEVNQIYARRVLDKWKVNLDLAVNCSQARFYLSEYTYDCILADVRLPDGDGLEVVTELRNDPRAMNGKTPVLVLTANAMEEERQRAKKMGIHAYIVKPFGQEQVFQHLATIFKEAEIQEAVEKTPKVSYMNPDYEYLAHLIKLLNGDKEAIIQMANVFLQQIPDTLRNMESALIKTDWNRVYYEAHRIKSTINTIGLKKLEPAIRLIDKYTYTGENLDKIEDLFKTFKEYSKLEMLKLKHEIKKLELLPRQTLDLEQYEFDRIM